MEFKMRFFLISVVFLLASSCIVVDTIISVNTSNEKSKQPQVEVAISYSLHDPIVITHDDNFTTEGFTGSGTWIDPYVLDGVSITTDGTCISISNTQAVFVIKNCLLTSTSDQVSNGVYLSNAPGGSVKSSIIYGKETGIYLSSNSDNCTFTNNTIYNNLNYGVRNFGGTNVTLMNNTIYSHSIYGFYTSEGGGMLYNNTIHDNDDSGVYLDDYANDMILINNTIYNNKYGITIDTSESHLIENNTITGNWYYGVYLRYSGMSSFVNNTLTYNGVFIVGFDEENWHHNFTDNTVNGKSLGYFWNVTSMIIDGALYGHVILANCTDTIIRDGSIYNSSIGILVGYSTNCTIRNTTLNNHGRDGISLRHSNNCTAVNNTIYSSYNGIQLYNSENTTLSNNTIHTMMYDGIAISQSDFGVISNNTIQYNSNYGARISISKNYTIEDNRFRENFWAGLSIYGTDNCDVMNNEFLNNDRTGIELITASENNTIYDNTIAWNKLQNARDDGYYNKWDDEISIGNIWSAYDGEGPYTIPGSAGAIDHYPQQADSVDPVFTSTQDDVQYGEGTPGPTLTWEVFDDHPVSYSVILNGSPISPSQFADNGVWNTSTISISLETDFIFDLGFRNLTLIIMDGCFNTAVDTVMITVIDVTPPFINHPADIEKEEHTNFQIFWNASDLHPTTYRVLKDGSEIQSGTYDQFHIIIVDVNSPSVGNYNFTCIVYDIGGNWVSDTVIVTITPEETETTTTTTDTETTSPPPTGLDPQLIMMITIVGVICIVIVVIVAKRRR